MDRCRCEDYRIAIDSLKFYTVGTYRPDIIENIDKTGFTVGWFKNRIDLTDLRFLKPKARKVLQPHEHPDMELSKQARKIKKMWCPYMLPKPDPLPSKDTDR